MTEAEGNTTSAADQWRERIAELLTMMLKEAQWKDGRLYTTLLEPFELLRRSNHSTSNGINGKGGSGAGFEIWLLR